jgi:putative ABC transport system permease protein
MRGVWQDIRYAIRSLARAPGFALAVILILALGIGANVAMFSVVNETMLRPLPYKDPQRLVMGRRIVERRIGPWVSGQDYYDYRDHSESFEALSASLGFPGTHTVAGGERPERLPGQQITVDLLPALGVRPALGREFRAEEGEPGGPDVVILSHGYWQRALGGADDVIGTTLTVDGSPRTVVGVMPPGFRYLLDVEIWLPLRPDSDWVTERRFHNCLVLGRLKPGVTLAEAQSELDTISAQLEMEHPETNKGKALLLTDLGDVLLSDVRPSLLVLMSSVGLVLLIACGNAASLLLARGSTRRRELAVRSAMGASRAQLVRQLLTESVVLSVLAGAVGTLLANDLQHLISRFLPTNWLGEPRVETSMEMLSFALLLSLITGTVAGIVPALRSSRTSLVEGLKTGRGMTDPKGARFRSGLVVAQVALSVILLIGSGLLIRSLALLLSVDTGFNSGNLLTAEIRLPEGEYPEREQRIQLFSSLQERVRALPGVADVALISQLPFRDPGNDTYAYAADNPPTDPLSQQRSAYQRTVFPGYFKAMGIPLLAGRDIEEGDKRGSSLVLVISETMARLLFPGQDAVGRQVVVDVGQLVTCEVVGVVGDVRLDSLRNEPQMAMYFSYRQRPHFTMRIAVRTAGEPPSIAATFRNAVWELDKSLPIGALATLEEHIGRSLLRSRTTTILLSLFAGIALFLAAMGLYGVLAYYVSQRFHEIGVRVALGASPAQVMEQIFRRGAGLTIAGITIGLAGALLITRLIRQMLFGVQPTDPTTFILVSLVFSIVAFIACLVPALRALRVNPISALQAE